MSHERRTPPNGEVNLGLIITPMLDMAFQILAFFIMTYHPSALEAHIPGSLAPPDDPAVVGNPRPGDLPLSPDADLLDGLKDAIHVKIKAVAPGQEIGNRLEGQPSQLFLQLPQDAQAVMLADVDVDFDVAIRRLENRLRELLKQGATTKADLKIEGDGDLRQRYIMEVYDTCKKVGFDKLHFVPPPRTK